MPDILYIIAFPDKETYCIAACCQNPPQKTKQFIEDNNNINIPIVSLHQWPSLPAPYIPSFILLTFVVEGINYIYPSN